jgi:hypothetical protein
MNATTIGLFLWAVVGAGVDYRYTKAGGRRPSEQSKWWVTGLYLVILIVPGILGASSQVLAQATVDLAIGFFIFWELARWMARRRYPLNSVAIELEKLKKS